MKPAGALAASRRIAGVFEERLKLTQERWIFGPEDKLIVQTMLGSRQFADVQESAL